MECFRLLFDNLAWIEYQFLSGIRDSKKAVRDDKRCRRSKEVNRPEMIGRGLGLGLLCWGFKGVQKGIRSKEASTLQIGSVAFPLGQRTSPQLRPCHWLFDQDGYQDCSSPSLESRPCSLRLLIIPEAQRLSSWDNWVEERGWDEGHWHAHTRGLPWGFAKVVGTLQQVHCSRRRLRRRGV